MITGGALLSTGVTSAAIGATTLLAPSTASDENVEGDVYTHLSFSYPLIILGGARSLVGAGLIAGGYRRWRRTTATRRSTEPPAVVNPLHLLIPGVAMMGVSAVQSALGSIITRRALIGGVPTFAAGLALVTVGTVRIRRRRMSSHAAHLHVSPEVGRTLLGTWTGGVSLRW